MDIVDQLKYAGDHVLFEPHLYHSAADEIERSRLANSDLQMHYDYAKDECDKLREENNDLKSALRNVLFAEVSHVKVTEFTKEKE